MKEGDLCTLIGIPVLSWEPHPPNSFPETWVPRGTYDEHEQGQPAIFMGEERHIHSRYEGVRVKCALILVGGMLRMTRFDNLREAK